MQEICKSDLRKIVLDNRDKLIENKYTKDISIFNTLTNLPQFIKSKNIFIYVSFGSEVATHEIIKKALDDGKNIFVPKIISKAEGMLAVRIQGLKELMPNKLNILEPMMVSETIEIENIDLLVSPGVAFDNKGNRLGYGGGFYDRFMSPGHMEKVFALAYDIQLIEHVPTEFFDIPIKNLITESGLKTF